MKLLFDENLAAKLVPSLADIFPGSLHVSTSGLEAANDMDIWEFARVNDFTIVTKDDDFRQRSFLFGAPPRVVWIRLGNCKTSEIEAVLRLRFREIVEFHETEGAALMMIARSTSGSPSDSPR